MLTRVQYAYSTMKFHAFHTFNALLWAFLCADDSDWLTNITVNQIIGTHLHKILITPFKSISTLTIDEPASN